MSYTALKIIVVHFYYEREPFIFGTCIILMTAESLQQPCEFRILNDEATALYITDPSITSTRALIFTDCHFSKFYPFEKTFPKFQKKIEEIIKEEQPNTIIILGDVVHIRTELAEERLIQVLSFFDKLNIKVYYIGGNHDRHIARKIFVPPSSNATIVSDLALCFVHPDPPPRTPKRIFFTHDLHNHYKLTREYVHAWHLFLRKTFAYLINPDDYLLTGHTHETIISVDELTASIAPFSFDLLSYKYAILTMDNGIQIKFPEGTKEERYIRTGFDAYSAPHTAKPA